MGCKYCGKPILGGHKNKKYCSPQCRSRYTALEYQRKKRGGPPIRHCAGCGKVLTYSARGATYCSSECRDRKRKELQPAGINALRFAALKQAQRDGVLKQWMASPSFYELYPELTPEQTKGVRHEENLQV